MKYVKLFEAFINEDAKKIAKIQSQIDTLQSEIDGYNEHYREVEDDMDATFNQFEDGEIDQDEHDYQMDELEGYKSDLDTKLERAYAKLTKLEKKLAKLSK